MLAPRFYAFGGYGGVMKKARQTPEGHPDPVPVVSDALPRTITKVFLRKVRSIAKTARRLAQKAHRVGASDDLAAAVELEVEARALVLCIERQGSQADEPSVITNAELIEFCRNHRYTGPLLGFLPQDVVTDIRRGNFKLGLDAAIRKRQAVLSAPLAAAASAAKAQKKAQSKKIIREKCEAYRATRPKLRMSASHIAKRRKAKINEALKLAGLGPYTEETLAVYIREINREASPRDRQPRRLRTPRK
jgi:hypothetical protein